jgi:hypothetical protein
MSCEVLRRWLEENSDPTVQESMPVEGAASMTSSGPEPGVEASQMDRDVATDDLVSGF